MPIAERHMRLETLDPIGGSEHLNPVWLEKLEELVKAGKTEAEAEAQLVTEKVEKTIKPSLYVATLRGKVNTNETARLTVKLENVELGKLYAVTFT